jgi:hypothetical protein
LHFRDKMQCWWIFDSETDYNMYVVDYIIKSRSESFCAKLRD